MRVELFRDLVSPGLMLQGAAKDSRVRTFGITDESVDMHNTTFALDGWDFDSRFMRNPLVLLNHGWSSDELPVIGRSAKPGQVGDRIEAQVEIFPVSLQPEADRVLGMVDAGVLGASIRATPDYESAVYNEDRETGDEWIDFWYPPLDFKRQTLIEWSVVIIGSNGNAVPTGRALDAKAFGTLAGMIGQARAAQVRAEQQAQAAQAHALGQVKNLPARLRKLLDRPELLDGAKVPEAPRAAPVQVPPPVPVEQPRVLELGGLTTEKIAELVGSAVDSRSKAKIEEELRVAEARRRGSLSLE